MTTAILVPMPINVALIIVGIAILDVAMSTVIQRTLGNPKKARSIQRKLNRINIEMREMIKNKAPQEHIMAKQKEMMPHFNESMKNSMKPMIVIFPVLLAIYYLLIGVYLSSWQKYVINFIFPMGYKELFIAVVFILGLVVGITIALYDRKKSRMEAMEEEALSDK